MDLQGIIHIQHIRNNKVIDEETVKNLIVDEGKLYLLKVGIVRSENPGIIYIGLKGSNVPITKVDNKTAIASGGIYQEITSYQTTNNTRLQYNGTVVSPSEISNINSPATFTFTNSATVYGVFLTTIPTWGDTNGYLIAAANFQNPRQLVAQDVLRIVYNIVIP